MLTHLPIFINIKNEIKSKQQQETQKSDRKRMKKQHKLVFKLEWNEYSLVGRLTSSRVKYLIYGL